MGWKGALRSLAAESRRAEREARRRQRELERQRKQLEKMQELERAIYEVQEYENHIDLLLSVHKECSDAWDWEVIQSSEPPVKPVESQSHAEAARARLSTFRPGLFDRALGRTESKREALAEAVKLAKEEDEREYQEALRTYERDYADWEATCELARRILAGDPRACIEAIKQTDPFSDISQLGSSINFHAEESTLVEATLRVNSEQVIPSEVKTLLKSGRLSVKKMPKTKFYELYQDYACGCVLRVARELLALLPIDMVIVNAVATLLDTRTGYLEEQPIVSAAIPRRTLETLNLDMLDPSDSMGNFVHRMAFRKTKGFEAVERLNPSDLQSAT